MQEVVEQVALDTDHDRVLWGRVAVGHEVAEGGVAIIADGLVEADRGGESVQLSVGLVEGLTITGGLTERSAEAGRAVAGDADEAGLLIERAPDGLADPEGGVGRELEAAAPVELVDGVLETEVALLDEVEEVHSLGERVTAGDRHDEAQVGTDEAVLGLLGLLDLALQRDGALAVVEFCLGLAALLDLTGEFTLVLRGEQGNFADVVQVKADGVIHGGIRFCLEARRRCRMAVAGQLSSSAIRGVFLKISSDSP